MFGFGKKKKPEEKKKSTIDKLIMGAIIGGAVGSVVGMSIAPKSGKETRELLTQKGKDIYEKGKEVSAKIQEEVSNAPVAQPPKKFLSKLKDKIFHRRSKHQKAELARQEEMKKIPHEAE